MPKHPPVPQPTLTQAPPIRQGGPQARTVMHPLSFFLIALGSRNLILTPGLDAPAVHDHTDAVDDGAHDDPADDPIFRYDGVRDPVGHIEHGH
jgi:hypothetical protein